MTITFLTSRTEIPMDEAEVEKLASRLNRSSTIRAAIETRDAHGVRLTPEQKSELLDVLEAWGFEPRGIPDMGDFADLRYELMRDLGVPPFDD